MTLPEKIKHFRKQRGWSQIELAEKLGVHVTHISRLETARYQPSVELLRKLAHAFEVTADYLLSDAEEFAPVKIDDTPMAQRLRLLETLDAEDRRTIINVIDSMLTKKKMLDLLLTGGSIAAVPSRPM